MLVKVDRDILNRALGVIEGVASTLLDKNHDAGNTLFKLLDTLDRAIVEEDA